MNKRQLIVLTALAIVVLGGVLIGRWLRPYDLDSERAAARAAGVPLSASDFPQTPIPDTRNSAPEYNALAALLMRKPLDLAPEVDTAMFVPLAKTPGLRNGLESRPDVAALVHRAASKPGFYHEHIWSPDEKFPYYSAMREAAKWVRRESLVRARDGQYLEAVRNQALGFNIARQAGMDPPLIAYLVSIACESITLDGLKDILREAGANARVADAVGAGIAAYRPTYNLTRSLRAEMMMGMTVIAQTRQSAGESYARQRGGPARDNPYVSKFWLKPNEAVYIHWMSGEILGSRQTGPARLAALKRNEAAMERLIDRGPVENPSVFITAMMAPLASKAVNSELKAAARRMVISSAAAVLAYRARHGTYPVTLEQAVSPAPIDPLTGRPLEYTATKTGFVVSAHPDTTGPDAKEARSLTESLQFRYPREKG